MTDLDALKAFRRKASYQSVAARRGAEIQKSSQPKTIRIGRVEVLNPEYKGK